MPRSKGLPITSFAVLLLCSLSPAATLTVALDGSGDYTDIQHAIDAAADGDTVLVKPGEYVIDQPVNFNRLHDPEDPASPAVKNIVVRSEVGPEVTVLRMAQDPVNRERASVAVFVHGETAESALEGFTLMGGSGTGPVPWLTAGGGVLCLNGSSPTLANCTISGNGADKGAGVLCHNSSPILRDCIVKENTANAEGGGVHCEADSSPTFIRCSILKNVADALSEEQGNGGGVYCCSSKPTFRKCTVAENAAVDNGEDDAGQGGGLFICDRSSVVLTDCLVDKNTADGSGGGSYVGDESSVILTNCIISGNDGSGVYCGWRSSQELFDCTVVGNHWNGISCWKSASTRLSNCVIMGNKGNGVQIASFGLSAAVFRNCTIWNNAHFGVSIFGWGGIDGATFKNCIVWRNRRGSSSGRALGKITYSCIEGDEVWPGEGNINSDPLFCGWISAAEVYVDASNPNPGDGTQDNPYRDLLDALGGFSLALSPDSPCIGSGEAGADMGADRGICDASAQTGRLVHVASGTYSFTGLNLNQNISIQGAASNETILEGGVFGLRNGAFLSEVTVTGGDASGITIDLGQSPQIANCIVAGNARNGVSCYNGSPLIVNCTITENGGHGLSCESSSPAIKNCILWDNVRGSISVDEDSTPNVTYSCIEGDEVWPGEGNINSDPLFCGWSSAAEVYVDASNPNPGDGTQDNPYRDLLDGVRGFSLALSPDSPCIGSGEAGADMGGDTKICHEVGTRSRYIYLASGTCCLPSLNLVHHVSIEGTSQEGTVIEGTVLGLRTGATLSDVTVTGGGGIVIASGQSPRIKGCLITCNRESGVVCRESSPRIENCKITKNRGAGVFCTSSSLALIGCDIMGNHGRGVHCSTSSPTLTNCTVSENSWGGVYCHTSSPILMNCTIVRNSGSRPFIWEDWDDCEFGGGGGGMLCSNSTPTLVDCTISDNVAREICEEDLCESDRVDCADANGGGLYCCGDSSAILTRCTIERNSAHDYGGGIFCEERSSLTLTDSLISGNSATAGAGIYFSGASMNIRNCVVSDNSTLHSSRRWTGGGIFCSGGAQVLKNCTISGNSATYGGGLACYHSSPILTNCILWHNAGGSIRAGKGSNPEARFSCIEGEAMWPGIGNANTDPLFASWVPSADVHVDASNTSPGDGTEENPFSDFRYALQGFSFALSPDSPCIGAGEGGANMGADTGTAQLPRVGVRHIHLAPGSYSLADLILPQKVIVSGSGPAQTLLEGTVFGLRSGSILSHVTVTEGTYGGVFVCSGDAPRVSDCVITKNLGGGIRCLTDSRPRVVDSTISRNVGRGLYSDGAFPEVGGCAFKGNQDVGVFLCNRSSIELTDCVMTGNDGAGLYSDFSSSSLTNCLVIGNGETGVRCIHSHAMLVNCTIFGNRPWSAGAGHALLIRWESLASLSNCILWGNLGIPITASSDSVLGVRSSCIEGEHEWLRFGSINSPPLFIEPGVFDFGSRETVQIGERQYSLPNFVMTSGDYHLQSRSPCIDAGTRDIAPSTDHDGHSRPCGAEVDIGVYEYCELPFIRGEVNGDGRVDLGDAVYNLNYQFANGPTPTCLKTGDTNDDGQVNIADPVYLLNHLFVPGSPSPPEPFGTCGPDPTPDSLSCEEYAHCP